MLTHTFPGFGERAPAGSQYSLEDLADEVHDHLSALGVQGAHVAGVSMGGMVAQHLALRHPADVRSLFLACTGATAGRPTVLQRADAADDAASMNELVPSTLARWFTPGYLATEPRLPGVAYVVKTLSGIHPSAFASGWRAIADHNLLDRLSAISVPVTGVAAEEDLAAPVERVREIVDGVARGRMELIPGAHMAFLEDPERFSRALQDHLDWAEGEIG